MPAFLSRVHTQEQHVSPVVTVVSTELFLQE